MMTQEEMQKALGSSRVVPLNVPNPHGPLGLDHLAAAVAQVEGSPLTGMQPHGIRRDIDFSITTWDTLRQQAEASTRTTGRRVTAAELAAAIVEEAVSKSQVA